MSPAAPSGGGPMSVESIEHELAGLRMNEDGTLALRSSVLNLVVVTDEPSAADVTQAVSNIAGRFPSRAIVLISDPNDDANVDVQLAVFCNVRSGSSAQVCAEQITIHAEGPPAEHLDSLAGPLLLPDLPAFLWYPGAFSSRSSEFGRLVSLADRVILNSAAAGDCGASLRDIHSLLENPATPAIGDVQWVGLSPWRSLIADTFSAPERSGELEKIERVEIMYAPGGECRAMLLIGWLASTLGWNTKSMSRDEGTLRAEFEGPAGDIRFEMSPDSPDARLRRIRIHSAGYTFQVSRHRELSDVRTTVMRDGELQAERTVHVGSFDLGVLVGEELQYRGRDHTYEAALKTAVEVLGS